MVCPVQSYEVFTGLLLYILSWEQAVSILDIRRDPGPDFSGRTGVPHL